MITQVGSINNRPYFGGFFVDEVYTHDGVFHADDVFCVALVRRLNPGVKVHRVHTLPQDLPPGTLSFDLAGAVFDHHTEPVARRQDGQAYSSLGDLWSSWGHFIVPDITVWEGVDQALVYPIDVADNGGPSCFVSELILGMNSDVGHPEAVFETAVSLASELLDTVLRKYSGVSLMLGFLRPYLLSAAQKGSTVVEIPFFRSDLVPYIKSMAPSVRYILSPDTSVVSGKMPTKTVRYALRSLCKKVSFKPSLRLYTSSGLAPAAYGVLFSHALGNMMVFSDRAAALAFLDCHFQRLGLA